MKRPARHFRDPIFPAHLSGLLGILGLTLMLAMGSLLPLATMARSQDLGTDIALLSERVLFVTSGGFWETAASEAETPAEGTEAETGEEKTEMRRGYYRLVVMRNADNTSKLHLQEIETGPDGPTVALSTEIEEINALGAYVTDLRREDSSGQAGFLAFIFLKTDLQLVEPDTWTLLVDEFGDITVEQATN